MIRNIKHKGLERFFTRGTKSGIRPEHEKRLRIILARLHAAREPKDMNLPGLRLHKLAGEYEGYWSVTVNANWRLIFRFEDGEFYDLDYLDYH